MFRPDSMMPAMPVRAAGLFAAALLLAGCIANPYQPERKFSRVNELRLMQISGSRIPQVVNLNDAMPTTISPVTIITRDAIDAGGAGELTDLLGFFSYDFSGGNH